MEINRRLADTRSDVQDTHTLEDILHVCAADSRPVLRRVFGYQFLEADGDDWDGTRSSVTYEEGAIIYARFNHLLVCTAFGGRLDTVLDHGVRALGLYYPNFRFAITRVDEMVTTAQVRPYLSFREYPQDSPCPDVDFPVQQLIAMAMMYIRVVRCEHAAVTQQLHAMNDAMALAAGRILACDTDTLAFLSTGRFAQSARAAHLLSTGRFAQSARAAHLRNYVSRSQPLGARSR